MPDGHDRQALVDELGRPTNLHRRAAGAVITVAFDADRGTLAFGCNGEEPRVALTGFGGSTALRPWVCIPGWCGGRLAVAPYYLHARA